MVSIPADNVAAASTIHYTLFYSAADRLLCFNGCIKNGRTSFFPSFSPSQRRVEHKHKHGGTGGTPEHDDCCSDMMLHFYSCYALNNSAVR